VSPALGGRRDAARRLAGGVWRLFGLSGAATAPGPPPSAEGDEAAARIDAARERLRSTIAAPDDDHRTE
jgi:hypothetical protein